MSLTPPSSVIDGLPALLRTRLGDPVEIVLGTAEGEIRLGALRGWRLVAGRRGAIGARGTPGDRGRAPNVRWVGLASPGMMLLFLVAPALAGEEAAAAALLEERAP